MSGDVVLVHGGWSSPADWRWVVDLLVERGFSVNALDLVSHRRADATRADDVAQLSDAVVAAGRPVVVVGWSYGGAVLTDLDVNGLDVVRLVYVAAVPGLPPRDEQEPAPPREADLSHVVLNDDGTAVLDDEWFLGSDPAVGTMNVEVVDHLKAHPRRPIALAAALAPQTRTAWREVNTTVILGRDDSIIPENQQRWISETLGDVRFVDCDHFIPFRQPQVIADVIAEALL